MFALAGEALLVDAAFGVEEVFEYAMFTDDRRFDVCAESEVGNSFEGVEVDLERLDLGGRVRGKDSRNKLRSKNDLAREIFTK